MTTAPAAVCEQYKPLGTIGYTENPFENNWTVGYIYQLFQNLRLLF